MPVRDILAFLVDLLSLAIACGLIFALTLQPRRSRDTLLFSLFSASVAFWALAAIVGNRLNLFDWSLMAIMQTRATAMTLIVATYYVFVLGFLRPRSRIIRVISLGLPILIIVSLVIIWGVGIFDAAPAGTEITLTLNTAGYIVLAAAVGYLIFTFWLIISSPDKRSNHLRIPTGLLIAAYAVNLVPVLLMLPTDTVLITIALLIIGWRVLQYQVFDPMNELNTELRVANRDLQQIVSDLAREKERVEQLNEDLRAANQYKSEFLANMSHELRTPLNSIIGYSELLQKGLYGELSPKQGDRLEKIYRNGKQLLALISDILDLNKIDSGKMRLDTEMFPLGPVIQSVIDEFRPEAEGKSLALSAQMPDDIPTIYGDPLRIRQIIHNLTDNAIKFTREGGVQLAAQRISVQKGISQDFALPTIGWLRDGQWIIATVKDTGIGIAPEDQARIFEEFSQADGSHTREFGGTGLGLAIAKKLIQMHDGQIWVRSRSGEGSTFFVALPADVKEVDKQIPASGNR